MCTVLFCISCPSVQSRILQPFIVYHIVVICKRPRPPSLYDDDSEGMKDRLTMAHDIFMLIIQDLCNMIKFLLVNRNCRNLTPLETTLAEYAIGRFTK